jgi:hypothetical protein
MNILDILKEYSLVLILGFLILMFSVLNIRFLLRAWLNNNIKIYTVYFSFGASEKTLRLIIFCEIFFILSLSYILSFVVYIMLSELFADSGFYYKPDIIIFILLFLLNYIFMLLIFKKDMRKNIVLSFNREALGS